MIDPKICGLIVKELKSELGDGQPLMGLEKEALETWVNQSVENRRRYLKIREPRNLAISMLALEKASIYQQEDRQPFIEGMARIDAGRKGINLMSYRLSYFKLVAAAAILLIVVTGTYHYWSTVFTANTYANRPSDALPGTNRAILKMANGTHIDLTAAPSGKIGGALSVVEKIDSGEIAYSGSSSIAPVLKPDGKPVAVQYDTIVTPRGGQYRLILPDGSKVVLNAASSLRFPTTFSGSSREVVLTGEAYFDIAPRAGAPFTVKVEQMTVTVLGTRFGIADYAEDDAIKTTLLDGVVKVRTPIASAVLRPSDQAIVSLTGTGRIKVRQLDDPETAIAFANGMFEFDRDSIASVMNQLARWYSVDVVYAGDPRKTFTGSLSRKKNASEILKVLQASGGVQFKIEGSKIFVHP